MTREERIELLQDQVQHNRISEQELELECIRYGLREVEDVLSPIGYNICDRCGALGDTETGLLWLDGFEWDDSNPEDVAVQDNLAREDEDYVAICWECVNDLKIV